MGERGPVRVTVDRVGWREFQDALVAAGGSRYAVGVVLDEAVRGITISLRAIARAKAEGRQASFLEVLGVNLVEFGKEAVKEVPPPQKRRPGGGRKKKVQPAPE